MTANTPHRYRADIDGLRAVAIILVVLFHSGVTALKGGFIGVDLFFVISGFLIGGIISKDISEGRFSFYQFYLRRIRRIAPALFFMMAILLLLGFMLLSPLEFSQLAKYSVAVFISVPNMLLIKSGDYFSIDSDLNPLLMTWSLGIEEQFYIALPFILLLAVRLKQSMSRVVLVLSLVSLAACIWVTAFASTHAFYLLPTRAWELGAGVLLALWKPQPVTGRAGSLLNLFGWLLIIAASVMINSDDQFPGWVAAIPVLAGCLMIGAHSELNQLLLENPLMRFIGKVSYSWYLWHWPLLSLARICSDNPLTVWQGLLISTLALGIAWLSWRFIEQPFRQARTGTRWVIPSYCASSVIAAGAMVLLWQTGGMKSRVSELVVNADSWKISAQRNPCLLSYGANLPSRLTECQPKSDRPGIALIGDSHAAALRDSVSRYALRQDKPLYQLTKASCPFLIGATRVVNQVPDHAQQCINFNQAVLKMVMSDKIDEVVISAYWASGMSLLPGAGFRETGHPEKGNLEALQAGMDRVIAQLKQAGKKITVIEDAPSVDVDPLRYSNNRNMPIRRELSAWLGKWEAPPLLSERTRLFQFPEEAVEKLLQAYKQKGVRVLSLRENLCNEQGCMITSGGLPLYYDNNHLSPAGGDIALGKNW
ncbi:acyltransferase family protein [Type-D symbiont of Plautia stali]|uniref:acyltransferase family protein n=1 Tax=Type-D symbiont of Plautia stali TaxID=1560356 RepID=UPI00073EDE55|nr:acyltransferase family protein [Type-D symbiont of Plautia stali]